jgi:tetratricopeptide (TPR) repeat protein
VRIARRPWASIALAFAVACGAEQSRLEAHLERASAYREEGRYTEAVLEYKNALQIDPNRAAAHYGLARSYRGLNQVSDTLWELQETARLDPGHLQARIELAELLRVTGDLEQALQRADEAIALAADDASARLLRAQALDALERSDEALAAYEGALELDSELLPALLFMANFHAGRGEWSEAEALLRRLVEIEPSFAAYTALARLLSRTGARDPEAEAAHLEALKRATAPERGLAYRYLAAFYWARGRFDDLEANLERGASEEPTDFELASLLVRFHASRGEHAKALAVMERLAAASPGEAAPLLMLAAYRSDVGNLPSALESVDSALKIDPENPEALSSKAEILLRMGLMEENGAMVEEGRSIARAVLLDHPRNPPVLLVNARFDLAEGQLAAAIEILERAIRFAPEWGVAHSVLGSALYYTGDRSAARRELMRALELDGSLLDSRALLSRTHAVLGDHELAIVEGRRVLRARPNDVATRTGVADSLVRLGRLEDARRELETIPEEQRDATILHALGRIAMLESNPRAARRHFAAAEARWPGNPQLLEAALELDLQDGRADESIERIERAVSASPEDVRLVSLQGFAYETVGRIDDAESRYRSAIELDPSYLPAYQRLVQHLARGGRVPEMIESLEEALAARPDAAPLYFLLGNLYELVGDPDRALQRYEEAVRLGPSFAPAKNNLANLLAERGEDLDRALDLAREAKELLPDSPVVADTLGWVLYQKGLASAAVSYLREKSDETRATIEAALKDLAARSTDAGSEGGTPNPEPPWAQSMREMLARLERGS